MPAKLPDSLWQPPTEDRFEFVVETAQDRQVQTERMKKATLRRGPHPTVGAIFLDGARLGRYDLPFKHYRDDPKKHLVVDNAEYRSVVPHTVTTWDGRTYKVGGQGLSGRETAAATLAFLWEVGRDPEPVNRRRKVPAPPWREDPLTGALTPRRLTTGDSKTHHKRSAYLSSWNNQVRLALSAIDAFLSKGNEGRTLLWDAGNMTQLRTVLVRLRNTRLPVILPAGQRVYEGRQQDLLTGTPLPERGARGTFREYISVGTRRTASEIRILETWIRRTHREVVDKETGEVRRDPGAQGQVWSREAVRAFRSKVFTLSNKLNAAKVLDGQTHPAAKGRFGGSSRAGEKNEMGRRGLIWRLDG